jgi:diamine N-acetyltransferase
MWHLGVAKEPWSRDVLRRYVEAQPGNLQRDGQLRLILERDGKPVGAFDLYDYDAVSRKAGIGLVVDGQFRGQGLGKKALVAFESYAHQTLGIHMLFAIVPVSNEASLALFTSCGFIQSGQLKDWLWNKGTFEDARMFQKILS